MRISSQPPAGGSDRRPRSSPPPAGHGGGPRRFGGRPGSGGPRGGLHGRGPGGGGRKAHTGALTPSRKLALEAELASDRGEGFAAEVLETNAGQRDLAAVDLGLAREICAGSLRCRRPLDLWINRFLTSAPESLFPTVRTILRQGAYQLAALTRVPPHAAVDQAVEQTYGLKNGVFKGLVNAVMRRLSETVAGRGLPDDGGRSRRRFLVRAALQPDGSLRTEWAELAGDLLPDYAADPLAHLAIAYSLPDNVVREFHALVGLDRLPGLLAAANTLPALTVRLNPAGLLKPLAEEQIFAGAVRARRLQPLLTAHPVEQPWTAACVPNPFLARADLPPEVGRGEWQMPGSLDDYYALPPGTHPADLPGLEAGLFVVQDRAAGEAARWLDPQPEETVLDLCAAPGGKTAQLAGLVLGQLLTATGVDPQAAQRRPRSARLIACDADPARLNSILDTAERCHLHAHVAPDPVQALLSDPPAGAASGPVDLRVCHLDGRQLPVAWVEKFDAVLVDAPCSNLGVLHRRWEARWRLEELGIARLIDLQRDLLASGAKAVKPGGRLVYTTCTLAKAENEDRVAAFLEKNKQFRLERQQSILPTPGLHDGAFVALLCRR